MTSEGICHAIYYFIFIESDRISVLGVPPTSKERPKSWASEKVTKRWGNICLLSQMWHLSCSLIESLKSVECEGRMENGEFITEWYCIF